MKKTLLFVLVLCILLIGCKEDIPVPAQPEKSIENNVSETAEVLKPENTYPLTPYDPIIVSDHTVLSEQEFSVGMRPENFILVKSGAVVELDGISLDKVDDESAEPLKTESGNAMLFGEPGSSISIGKSILSGDAPYSHAVCLFGTGSVISVTDSGLSVTGVCSDALHISGATANITDSTLIACGENGSAVYTDSGIVSCKNTLVTTSDSAAGYSVGLVNGVVSGTDSTFNGKMYFDGDNEFTLHGSNVNGTFFSKSDLSSVIMRLTEYSTLISSCDDSARGIQLFLDKTSGWELQSDMYLESLTMEDSDFSNIKDNGFSIYYNSENMENEWLQNKTYPLQDGGFLAPLI